jgi:hypothetical protein
VVWLEAWPGGNAIRFAQLKRPTHFLPKVIVTEEINAAQSWSARVATVLRLNIQPSSIIGLKGYFQPDQLQRDLHAIVTLIGVVSLYVIIKFIIGRWLAFAFK